MTYGLSWWDQQGTPPGANMLGQQPGVQPMPQQPAIDPRTQAEIAYAGIRAPVPEGQQPMATAPPPGAAAQQQPKVDPYMVQMLNELRAMYDRNQQWAREGKAGDRLDR